MTSLLQWFRGVSSKRDMPWRAPFVHASDYASSSELREARKKRAYQVWISEIMLQQTRVETVKSYWLNWMAKWPTIEALASAPEEDVLAAWRGLGYYSRATRIHTAAKKVVDDPTMAGLLPDTPIDLQRNVPGVGPYTAGAISSIVYGHPVPILDGNVARVLSRQLALYANPKAKATTDLLWEVADVLVKKAYEVEGEQATTPGEWNQALMELGSTLCTPLKPGCTGCPIRQSCRAYQEAETNAARGNKSKDVSIADMEDLCMLCEPFPLEEELDVGTKDVDAATTAKQQGIKKLRQATLSFGFTASTPSTDTKRQELMQVVEKHVRKYPMKLEKNKIRQEECLVCIVRRGDGEFLLEHRPSSGLLASMWQFPSLTLSTTAAGPSSDNIQQLFPSTPLSQLVDTFVAALTDVDIKAAAGAKKEKIGSITHIFSHLKLSMHVYKITLPAGTETCGKASKTGTRKKDKNHVVEEVSKSKNFGSKLSDKALRRWANADEVEAETMGTGMRNCWRALQTHDQLSMKPAQPARAAASKASKART